MPQIFSRKFNRLPHLSLLGSVVGSVVTIAIVWYFFSPSYTDVGYAPTQPVPISHRKHSGQLGIDCRYCHNWVEVSQQSNIPPTQTCMNCHSQVKTESLLLQPVRESWATGRSIEWVKVHHLPDYARFSHEVHVNKGLGCETCHGRVDQMDVVRQVELHSMGWCLDCHREPEQYLRTNDEVTTMGYIQPSDYIDRNLERIRVEGIQPPANCSACHY